MRILHLMVVLLVIFSASCSRRTVTRTEAGLITDLSGRWNDTDARMVAQELVEKIIAGRWLDNYYRENENRLPTVVIGRVINASTEHIQTDVFMNEIESALINSGYVQMVARSTQRDELRTERADQSQFASSESAAAWGKEVGAEFLIMGSLRTIVDQSGRQRVTYYQVSLDITNTETNVKVWSGNHELKKIIEW